MQNKLICLISFVVLSLNVNSKTIKDVESGSLKSLFKHSRTTYVIRYKHVFQDTIIIPANCVIIFEGGHLSGPVIFNNTMLRGDVCLKGSSIRGSVKNNVFDASWICNIDGKTDDANIINEVIRVCGNVFFPKGRYCLISEYDPRGFVPDIFFPSIKTHIGINRNNVTLRGEDGTLFESVGPLGTLCFFSQPNQIHKSISNINVENIMFKVYNDGKNFYEFMHTIKLIGVKGMIIRNCKFCDFWGDAICLSHYGDNPKTGERTRNQDVEILNNLIVGGEAHNNRNGISIINGKNVIIKNNIIKNTSRKDMPGGVDVEPNNSAYTIENIRIEKNYFEGIQGTKGAIGILISKDAPAHGIHIINNTVERCTCGISILVATDMTTNDFLVMGNRTDKETTPYNFGGRGRSKDWVIKNNTWGKPMKEEIPGNIKVTNLVMKNNKKKFDFMVG